MAKKTIYELFTNKKADKNLVEVMDCYDYRYGNIYYNGELISNFYKESYQKKLGSYSLVTELQALGLNIKKATVIIYCLEPLRDYQDQMSIIDFDAVVDNTYEELLEHFTQDLIPLQQVIQQEKNTNSYFNFIRTFKLTEFL